jgi:hypothetical protein
MFHLLLVAPSRLTEMSAPIRITDIRTTTVTVPLECALRHANGVIGAVSSLYNNRTQLLAAIEFACLDIVGQALDLPVHLIDDVIAGGKLKYEEESPISEFKCFAIRNHRPPEDRCR